MKVLSLFDGMSCGRIALDQLGIPVETYYASEIDKYAIQVSQANYPEIEQVGDICNLDPKDYQDVDLMLAGSPCQGFSFAGKQLAFDDPRSALFFEFIRLLKAIKPKYFLLENVRMKKEFLDVITQQVSECYEADDVAPEFKDMLGNVTIKPHFINSSLLSAQSRQRYYWTNIPGVKQPKDRGIVLRDILETETDERPVKDTERNQRHYKNEDEKSLCMTATMYKGAGNNGMTLVPQKPIKVGMETKPKQVGIATDINGHDILKRVYSPDGKSPTVNTCQGGNREPKVVVGGALRARLKDKDGKHVGWKETKPEQMLELRKDNKSNAVSTVSKDSIAVNEDLTWRKLTPLECERLQTVPDNYTNHVSNTRRYAMLGNGWTIEVIKHILQNMERQ
jgi:DNA-cytosine methyltransferase